MKRALITLFALCIPSFVYADHIGLYSTPDVPIDHLECSLTNVPFAPTVFSVYVVHYLTPGTTGSRWRIVDTSGLTHVTVAQSCCNVTVVGGDPYTGIALNYNECIVTGAPIYRLGFLWLGTPLEGCHQLAVVPFPGDTEIVVADCAPDQQGPNTGGRFSLGPNAVDCMSCSDPVPVETSTWGAVKALYR